jgi:hypothetical protein
VEFLRIGRRAYNLDRIGFAAFTARGEVVEMGDEPPVEADNDLLQLQVDGEEYWLEGDDARRGWSIICAVIALGDKGMPPDAW